MNHIPSTFQNYQPILVGASFLAMGYLFGKHCRSTIENCINIPMTSNETCCVQNERIYALNNIKANKDTIEIVQKMNKIGKRDLCQDEIFGCNNLEKNLRREEEDVLWGQTCAFKKHKGLHSKEILEKHSRSIEDSDDEILAQRLEYFPKGASCTKTPINKPRGSNFSKLNKRKKSRLDLTISRPKVHQGKEIVMDSYITLSKGTRSFSNYGALAIRLHDQGVCPLEDTCEPPKTMCLDHTDARDGGCYEVLLKNNAFQNKNEEFFCSQSLNSLVQECTLNNLVEEYPKDNMSIDKDHNSLNLLDLQCKTNECNNNSNNIVVCNEKDNEGSKEMENIADEDNVVLLQVEEKKLDLPMSPLLELHG